jgi:hypothetical protein
MRHAALPERSAAIVDKDVTGWVADPAAKVGGGTPPKEGAPHGCRRHLGGPLSRARPRQRPDSTGSTANSTPSLSNPYTPKSLARKRRPA